MADPSPAADVGNRRQLAVDLFNHVWTLLRRTDRSQLEDDEMLHAAHASRYHWGEVRCLALCEEHGIGDFDLAFAHEAVGRALRVAGDHPGADAAVARAHEAAADIAEQEDRELVLSDLATVERS